MKFLLMVIGVITVISWCWRSGTKKEEEEKQVQYKQEPAVRRRVKKEELDEDADYEKLRVKDLQSILEDRGLKVSGKRAELIERLKQDDQIVLEEADLITAIHRTVGGPLPSAPPPGVYAEQAFAPAPQGPAVPAPLLPEQLNFGRTPGSRSSGAVAANDVLPTEKQVRYASRLSRETGIPLGAAQMQDKRHLSAWISQVAAAQTRHSRP